MKTTRHPLWNQRHFRETARALKNKLAPDVCLVESGHQNQTRRLAQRFCWLEPAVPPPLPASSPSHSAPHAFFLFLLFVCALLILFPGIQPSILPFSPWKLSPITFPQPFSTLSFRSSWKTTGLKAGLGRSMFLASTAVLSYGHPPPSRCAVPVNRQFLTVVYLRTSTRLPHRPTVFSQKSNGAGKYV